MKRLVMMMGVAAVLATGSLQASTQQQMEARPSGGAMIADALIARPLLLVATLGGTALFVVSLPFSAMGGNVDQAAETLVKTPAEATFRRCLGCTSINSRPAEGQR
ncbi:hypothetical protein [Billgrantia kenyensis]|uniref:Multidrug transporter n=1 Tax=Billgrantia kenyensis TaxID=321266 RepID=A0A7V9W3R9_9GAMM|nr:hypothetical protein [Halomonas kenyensis]MBA2780510.1 hypothetical protein [Halomonas kenyensis]MCG6663430.1 hypothetical protein [Halomonas kenyensis]